MLPTATPPDTQTPSPATTPAVLNVEHSVNGRRWSWREGADSPATNRLGAALAQQLGIPEIVGRLLAMRGVSPEHAPHFLAPSLRALMPDPSCLTDMDKAAARMAQAVQAGETIGIFGDYDVDGACASAVLAALFEHLGCAVLTHIPDRITQGYAPNLPALDALAAQGARPLVTGEPGDASAPIEAVSAAV